MVVPRPRPRRVRLPLLAIVLLASCSVGLDARFLERLDYGMEHQHVEPMLETDLPALPVLRFFAEDDLGGGHDCLVELYEGRDRAPDYVLVSIDGRLQAALGRRSYETWWRRRSGVCPWTPETLQAVMQDAVAARVPLDWARLQAHHAELVNPNKHMSPRMSDRLLGVPGEVLMAPIWFVRDLIYGDVSARDAEVRAFLLRVAPRVPFDEVCAAIGAPTAEWEALDNGGPQRLCVYDFGFGYSHTLGFLDGRLLWIEFGP